MIAFCGSAKPQDGWRSPLSGHPAVNQPSWIIEIVSSAGCERCLRRL